MRVHTRACLSATCVHAWIQAFSTGWWEVRAQLVEKSPDNVFNPQHILQWGPNVYFTENIFFPESKQGEGAKISGGPTFSKIMGPNCFFHRTCCFPGGSGLPVPPLDSRIAYVHVSMFVAF